VNAAAQHRLAVGRALGRPEVHDARAVDVVGKPPAVVPAEDALSDGRAAALLVRVHPHRRGLGGAAELAKRRQPLRQPRRRRRRQPLATRADDVGAPHQLRPAHNEVDDQHQVDGLRLLAVDHAHVRGERDRHLLHPLRSRVRAVVAQAEQVANERGEARKVHLAVGARRVARGDEHDRRGELALLVVGRRDHNIKYGFGVPERIGVAACLAFHIALQLVQCLAF